MQDPKVMGQIGQNPMAKQIQAAIMAHIAEHVAFQYRVQLEKRLGATLPAPNTEMPEEVEVQLSKLVAQAATQLTQIHQGEAAQKQAQQQAQDPIVQMQQAELQLKQQELALKAQTEAQKIQLEMAKIQSQEKIAGVELGSKIAMDKEKVKLDMAKENTKQMQEGLKLGLEAVNKERNNVQKEDQITVDALNKLAEQLNKSNKKE